jgi:hypothetical protein
VEVGRGSGRKPAHGAAPEAPESRVEWGRGGRRQSPEGAGPDGAPHFGRRGTELRSGVAERGCGTELVLVSRTR